MVKKKGPGRPKLPKGEQGKLRRVRVTDRMWKLWETAAGKRGVSKLIKAATTRAAKRILRNREQ